MGKGRLPRGAGSASTVEEEGFMNHRGSLKSRTRWAGAFALAGLLLSASQALAGPNTGKISFSIGNDITTAYFFRGILQERRGFIWQPYGEVNVNAYSDEDENAILTGITPFVGTWNSVHSENTLSSGSGPDNWYESDVYIGVKFTLLGKLELKPFYIAYTYPNGAFPTVQEFDFTATFNDSEYLGMWAMYPSITYAREMEHTALGVDEGDYMEFNLRPTFTVIESETYPVSLAVPLQLGLGIEDYYEGPISGNNETFGFFKGGVVASVPLAFVPEEYGAWSVSAGAAVYTFGNVNEAYNEGDDPWVVGTWSINMAY
jgi:hypothetical protein